MRQKDCGLQTEVSYFTGRRPVALRLSRGLALIAIVLASGATLSAQTDPWSATATKIGVAFTGPIAKGFALVAIVLGGLQLAFSEGGGKQRIGGLIFGLGLALGAASFLSWLFP